MVYADVLTYIFQFSLGITDSPMLCLYNPKIVEQKQYKISAEIQFIFKSCIWDVDKIKKITDGYAQSRETLLLIAQI
jgi:hypothetical protein